MTLKGLVGCLVLGLVVGTAINFWPKAKATTYPIYWGDMVGVAATGPDTVSPVTKDAAYTGNDPNAPDHFYYRCGNCLDNDWNWVFTVNGVTWTIPVASLPSHKGTICLGSPHEVCFDCLFTTLPDGSYVFCIDTTPSDPNEVEWSFCGVLENNGDDGNWIRFYPDLGLDQGPAWGVTHYHRISTQINE